MADKTAAKEPLFHIVKRDSLPSYKSWAIRIISVIAALIVCALMTMFITHQNPIDVYSTMIKGSFGSSRRFWMMFQNLAMLLCVSLAVTPAFKMRFWNIGAEGLVLIGGLATAACMILLGGNSQRTAYIRYDYSEYTCRRNLGAYPRRFQSEFQH